MLSPDEVDEIVDLFPSHCDGCADELAEVNDPAPHRYQQVEVPPIKPHTTEWRCHQVACPRCRHKTRAPYDPDIIPASPFGPRLMALVAFLTGVYHVSRRKTVVLLSELLGVRISLGALSAIEARVSDALAPAVEDAWSRVGAGHVKHTDGTSWLQAGATRALWTIATTAATVFKILADNSKATLEPLYGALRGILVSDRAKALNFWAMDRRQICWPRGSRSGMSVRRSRRRDGAVSRHVASRFTSPPRTGRSAPALRGAGVAVLPKRCCSVSSSTGRARAIPT